MTKLGFAHGYALVTGGAGFIGTNLVQRLVSEGTPVVVLDNLSRTGVEDNARWLQTTCQDRVRIVREDCCNQTVLGALVRGANQIFHFAAQVAVTTSLASPLEDFLVNARGTLQLLEAVRSLDEYPPLVFTSTNKVYGALEDLELRTTDTRCEPADPLVRSSGISESRPLDFHSPYGCSKGAADQYVLDYARTYGLHNVVFRMSCIYGPHQHGNEDQGWVAHFMLQALRRQPITLYGDGRQVRDLLFVDDLVEALLLARDRAHELAGQAFNIGGGPDNTVSLLELLGRLETLVGSEPQVEVQPARVGDQRYFAADVSRFTERCGWRPRVSSTLGLSLLLSWLARSGVVGTGPALGPAPRVPGVEERHSQVRQ